MNTLHKLAGVQETSENNQAPAPVASRPAPPPIPKDDASDLDAHSSHSRSRASLPLNRRPSHRSFGSRKSRESRRASHANGITSNLPADYPASPGVYNPNAAQRGSEEEADEEEDEDEFTWGPSHPCFPHPNPHCAPDSAEYHATRVIRVKRDWLAAGDLYPQYANLYPEILDPLISDNDFRFLISSINGLLRRVFSPYTTRAWTDALLGAFTGYLWDDLGFTGAKRGEKELEQFIDRWNTEREKEGKEVRVVQLRKTGFMNLDIVIPDPGIDAPREDGSDDEQDVGDAMATGGAGAKE